MSADVELSVVIPSWNTRELLRVCLEKLAAAEKPSSEVIVVENGSADGSGDMVRAGFPDVRLIQNAENLGFAKGCNQGMRAAVGRYVLLLNTDTEVAPDALVRLHRFLEEHAEYGAAAPRLVHANGSTQRTVMAFPGWWTPLFFATPLERWLPRSRELQRYFLAGWDQEDERDVDQPPAACLLLRRRVLEEVGLFDEELWLFFNDVDLSLRMARAGWKTRYLAGAVVVHHVGASTSKFGRFVPVWQQNRLAFYRKHFGRLAAWWVKACVSLAFADFAARQLGRRLARRAHEPLGPTLREYVAFLLRA